MTAMTINLLAINAFHKGDVGRISGHVAIKTDPHASPPGSVVALQDIKAGTSGWFDKRD
jgi:hypothetical protein